MEPGDLGQIIPLPVAAIIIEGIALTILTYLVLKSKGEPPVIEEVFAVYRDGRLVTHVTGREGKHIDDDIFTGMLTVAQKFIQDSFNSRDSSGLQKIEFGKKRIFFERGEYIYLALVYTGDATKRMKDDLVNTINAIELKYADVLENWKGEIGELVGMEEQIRALLSDIEE